MRPGGKKPIQLNFKRKPVPRKVFESSSEEDAGNGQTATMPINKTSSASASTTKKVDGYTTHLVHLDAKRVPQDKQKEVLDIEEESDDAVDLDDEYDVDEESDPPLPPKPTKKGKGRQLPSWWNDSEVSIAHTLSR